MNRKDILELRGCVDGLRNVFCSNCGMTKWIVAGPGCNGHTLDVTSRCCNNRDYRI